MDRIEYYRYYLRLFFLFALATFLFLSCEEEKPVVLGEELYPKFCRTSTEILYIKNHNIIGKWELYDIVDERLDTTYFPSCHQDEFSIEKYRTSIEFTSIPRESTEDESDYLWAHIQLGDRLHEAWYFVTPEDSLEFHCSSTVLFGGSTSNVYEFSDLYFSEICHHAPLKITFTKYFLILTNRKGVQLKYIIYPE